MSEENTAELNEKLIISGSICVNHVCDEMLGVEIPIGLTKKTLIVGDLIIEDAGICPFCGQIFVLSGGRLWLKG